MPISRGARSDVKNLVQTEDKICTLVSGIPNDGSSAWALGYGEKEQLFPSPACFVCARKGWPSLTSGEGSQL